MTISAARQHEVEDDDARWRRFAARPEASDEVETPPGRLRRAMRALGRAATHEWSMAALASLAISAAMNWRALSDPTRTIPQDLGDPLLVSHVLGWSGHALRTDPAGLWNINTFYPVGNGYAFTDTFLGYAPAALLGAGPEAALLRYNLLFVLAWALAFFGAYVLLRQLGARTAGSLTGAAIFAYAPWKLAQAGHLQVLSVGAIALALAMLARGHGWSLRRGYRIDEVRPGWIVTGWITATWQVSVGFGMGLPFAYFLAGLCVVGAAAWLIRRPRVPWPAAGANLIGITTFAVVSAALAMPHIQAQSDHPEAARSLDYVDQFSPAWSSFLIAPEQSALWGETHAGAREGLYWPPETTLLLGFAAMALAAAGLAWSSWTRRQRLFLALGVALTLTLAMGTNFVNGGRWTYALLFEHVPGFDALRTPGRLVLYTSLLLAVLAAGTLTHLADRLDAQADADRVDVRHRMRAPAFMQALAALPLLFVLAEGYSGQEHPEVPEAPLAMSELEAPIMVLPSHDGIDTLVQHWSVDGYPDLVNGVAAFTPRAQAELRRDSGSFPSVPAVERLREAGVRTVVVLPDRLEGTDWEYLLELPTADPSVTVVDHGAAVVYHL